MVKDNHATYHNMPLLELFSCLNEILLILKQEVDNSTVDESSVLFLHNIIEGLDGITDKWPKC